MPEPAGCCAFVADRPRQAGHVCGLPESRHNWGELGKDYGLSHDFTHHRYVDESQMAMELP